MTRAAYIWDRVHSAKKKSSWITVFLRDKNLTNDAGTSISGASSSGFARVWGRSDGTVFGTTNNYTGQFQLY